MTSIIKDPIQKENSNIFIAFIAGYSEYESIQLVGSSQSLELLRC